MKRHALPPANGSSAAAPRRTRAGSAAGVRDALRPTHRLTDPETRVYVGDCRAVLPRLPAGDIFDLIFADPPFNWARDYDRHKSGGAWDDRQPAERYCNARHSFGTELGDVLRDGPESLAFTQAWLDLCILRLADHGSIWVNIPDTWAAEIVVHLKQRGLAMVNWCVWHYRFGQNTRSRFINSKVHALYFMKDPAHPGRRWNPDAIAEVSDRRAIYGDPRTETKKDGWLDKGHRVPMDVWYGPYWGRVQGNNYERRHKHDNQLPEVYLGRVLKACTAPGDLVFDPFLGSGTTGVVARYLGRRFVGVEHGPQNAEHAFERIQAGPVRAEQIDATAGSSAIHPPRRGTKRPSAQDG